MEKPGNVNAIGGLLLAGGIMASLVSMGMAIGSGGCWLFWLPGLVGGIYAIIQGSQLLGDAKGIGVPTLSPVMLILNVFNCDMMSMTMGIIALALMQDPKARAYLEGLSAEELKRRQREQAQQAQGQRAGQQPNQATASTQGQRSASAASAWPTAQAGDAFVAPNPQVWGAPPGSDDALKENATPPQEDTWASTAGWGDPQTWGAPSHTEPPEQARFTLPEAAAPAEDRAMWDDMADWERRFADATDDAQDAEVTVGVPASKKDRR